MNKNAFDPRPDTSYEVQLGYSVKNARNKKVQNKTTHKVKAFFIAPLLIPFVISILFFAQGSGGFISGNELGFVVLLIGIPITYLAVLILGLPAYIMLEEYDKLSYLSLFIAGAIAGGLVSFGVATEGRFTFKGITGVPDEKWMMLVAVTFLCGVTAILYGKIAKGI